jgi:hypothetical protein
MTYELKLLNGRSCCSSTPFRLNTYSLNHEAALTEEFIRYLRLPTVYTEISIDDRDQATSGQDFHDFQDDERYADVCLAHAHNDTPSKITIWGVSVNRPHERVKALCGEVNKRIYGESLGSLPLVIAVQDLCYKQAFHGIPGYQV